LLNASVAVRTTIAAHVAAQMRRARRLQERTRVPEKPLSLC
jgi:hypothetical protein